MRASFRSLSTWRPARDGTRTRRRNKVAVVLLAAGTGLSAVAACGSSGDPAGGAASSGVLRVGFDLSGSNGDPVTFDVADTRLPGAQILWSLPIYDSLLRYSQSGELVPSLATSATVVDPQTVEIKLRAGVRFSDGTPFDAEAVKAGVLRNQAAEPRGQFDSTLQDVSSIDVDAPDSLTVHLSRPVAGTFYALLAGMETFIASPTASTDPAVDLADTPIGAGAFTLKEYVPNQRIVLAKNPGYWNAAEIDLTEIQIINIPGGPQQVNALKTGTVDLSAVSLSDVPAIQNDSSLHLDSRPAENAMLWMPMCKSEAPLDDVRVRQALNYAVDRDGINQSLLAGAGEPQWALWSSESIYYPQDLDGEYAYDPDKARQLLAEAGYPDGLELNLITLPGNPLVTQAAQVVQESWKAIGVTLTITQTTNFVQDVYVSKKAQLALLPAVRGGLNKITGPFGEGSIGNLCGYTDPELNDIVGELGVVAPGSPESLELWGRAQELIVGDALAVWVDWIPVVTAWNQHVADANMITSYLVPMPDLTTVHMTAGG